MTLDSPNSSPNLNPSFHPLISNFAFPSTLPLFINTQNQDLSLYHHHFPLPSSVHETLIVGAPPSSNSKPPPPPPPRQNKGRHSKIRTLQGLRDRRVRLSIGIARQFFDLQDMLGFDKASKTLDWLLSRSKNAIRELARSKHQSDCHVATVQTDSIGSNGDHTVNVNNPDNLQGTVAKEEEKKKNIPRVRKKKKICCGKPTAMNQSALATASNSTSTSAQKNNNYYFPNLAIDWDDRYNPVLPQSSFVVSNMNLSETGFDVQRDTMY